MEVYGLNKTHLRNFFSIKPTDALISQIYFVKKLHIILAVPLPIIRSFPLYIRHWYVIKAAWLAVHGHMNVKYLHNFAKGGYLHLFFSIFVQVTLFLLLEMDTGRDNESVQLKFFHIFLPHWLSNRWVLCSSWEPWWLRTSSCCCSLTCPALTVTATT
jgi:hypothetical protein